MAPPLEIDSLDHLVLTVADVGRTVDFYERVLGMRPVTFGDGRRALVFGRQKLNLHQAGREFEPKARAPVAGSADFCLLTRVPLSEVAAHLEGCGVPIEEGPVRRTGARADLESLYLRDPDGNLVEVANELAVPAPEVEAFASAASFFGAVVARTGGRWDERGLGAWTVRDLVGHTSRALSTVQMYLASPAEDVVLPTAADYYVAAASSLADPEAVTERGRAAGRSLGPDPAHAVEALVESVTDLVGRTAADAPVATPVGGMRLREYLRTRTFELTVHTLDLCRALGIECDPPAEALDASVQLASELALRRGQGRELLSALTGRSPLPPGFTVV